MRQLDNFRIQTWKPNQPGMAIHDNPMPQHKHGPSNRTVNTLTFELKLIKEEQLVDVIDYKLEYHDIFDEDYRQYIMPWDGKTKIQIDPQIVGLDPQQLSMMALHALLDQGEFTR